MRLWRGLPVLQPIPPFHLAGLAYSLAFAREAIGAAFAAVLLSAPVAWLVRERPLSLAFWLSASAAVALLPGFVIGIRYVAFEVPALLAFFFVCWLVCALVANRQRRRAA